MTYTYIKDQLANANGWIRLWIVFSFAYFLLCSWQFLYNLSGREDISHTDSFYRELPLEMRKDLAECELKAEARTPIICQQVQMPNKHILLVPEAMPDIEIEKISKEYVDVIQLHSLERNFSRLLSLFLNWLLVCSSVLATGFAFLWVRNGFKKK